MRGRDGYREEDGAEEVRGEEKDEKGKGGKKGMRMGEGDGKEEEVAGYRLPRARARGSG
ncbi:hypothetical protein C1H46_023213 [Malus baccata]|uniref:Uncharacterized protein n=1 Tax=Malus baccata TaxID=106549 RepID=A0A540LXZ0_MALBA|nr:hypothetical protein C1H46_023213 [Malus baccata]